jgi:exosortase
MSTHIALALPYPSAKRGLTIYAAPAIVVSLVVALYARIVVDLFSDWWTQPNLSQGLVIVPLAMCLAWGNRNKLSKIACTPARKGLVLVGIACFLYVLGKVAAEFFLSRMSLIVLIAGCVWTFDGFARLRALSFPLVLLAASIPLPAVVYNTAAAPLQLFASDMGASLAQMLGVAVYRDGNIINLAYMSLGVEEACSGLNSLSAMLVGGIFLGFLLCKRALSRWILVLLSIPVAIAANIIRITGTAVLGDYNDQFARGFYHALSGWLIFVIGFAALYAATKLIARAETHLG